MRHYVLNEHTALDEQHFKACYDVFSRGGIIVHASDTCYGLACRADDKTAMQTLNNIKERDPNKPLIVLVQDIRIAHIYAYISKEVEEWLSARWPGPHTFILPSKWILPDLDNSGTIALRMPNHKLTQSLVQAAGGAMASTSANIAGKESPYTKNELAPIRKKQDVSVFIDSGDIQKKPVSALYKVWVDGQMQKRR